MRKTILSKWSKLGFLLGLFVYSADLFAVVPVCTRQFYYTQDTFDFGETKGRLPLSRTNQMNLYNLAFWTYDGEYNPPLKRGFKYPPRVDVKASYLMVIDSDCGGWRWKSENWREVNSATIAASITAIDGSTITIYAFKNFAGSWNRLIDVNVRNMESFNVLVDE